TQVGPVRGEPEVVTEHGGGGQPQDDVLAHAFDQVGLGRGVNVDGDASPQAPPRPQRQGADRFAGAAQGTGRRAVQPPAQSRLLLQHALGEQVAVADDPFRGQSRRGAAFERHTASGLSLAENEWVPAFFTRRGVLPVGGVPFAATALRRFVLVAFHRQRDRKTVRGVQRAEAARSLERLQELGAARDLLAASVDPRGGQRSPQHRAGDVVVGVLPGIGADVAAHGDRLGEGDRDTYVLAHAFFSSRKRSTAAWSSSSVVQVIVTQPSPRRRLAPIERMACPATASTRRWVRCVASSSGSRWVIVKRAVSAPICSETANMSGLAEWVCGSIATRAAGSVSCHRPSGTASCHNHGHSAAVEPNTASTTSLRGWSSRRAVARMAPLRLLLGSGRWASTPASNPGRAYPVEIRNGVWKRIANSSVAISVIQSSTTAPCRGRPREGWARRGTAAPNPTTPGAPRGPSPARGRCDGPAR